MGRRLYNYTQHSSHGPCAKGPRCAWRVIQESSGCLWSLYVVCIVCLLDACPLPPSQLDHNTCASNPEQANSQVKIPFIIRPTTVLPDILCNDSSRFLLDYHFISLDLLFSLFPVFVSFFIYLLVPFHLRSVWWACYWIALGSIGPLESYVSDIESWRVYTSLAIMPYTGPDHTETSTELTLAYTSLTSNIP